MRYVTGMLRGLVSYETVLRYAIREPSSSSSNYGFRERTGYWDPPLASSGSATSNRKSAEPYSTLPDILGRSWGQRQEAKTAGRSGICFGRVSQSRPDIYGQDNEQRKKREDDWNRWYQEEEQRSQEHQRREVDWFLINHSIRMSGNSRLLIEWSKSACERKPKRRSSAVRSSARRNSIGARLTGF